MALSGFSLYFMLSGTKYSYLASQDLGTFLRSLEKEK